MRASAGEPKQATSTNELGGQRRQGRGLPPAHGVQLLICQQERHQPDQRRQHHAAAGISAARLRGSGGQHGHHRPWIAAKSLPRHKRPADSKRQRTGARSWAENGRRGTSAGCRVDGRSRQVVAAAAAASMGAEVVEARPITLSAATRPVHGSRAKSRASASSSWPP